MGGQASKGLSDDQLSELKSNTNFSGKEIQDWYDKFHEDFPDGVITQDKFIAMYCKLFPDGNPRSFAKHVFRSYDKDGNGEIDFHEFMSTLSVASRGSAEEKLHWAFQMYDLDKDGVVSMAEVVEIIISINKLRGEKDRQLAEDAAMKIFLHMDKNKDGMLSEDEFIQGALASKTIMEVLQGGM